MVAAICPEVPPAVVLVEQVDQVPGVSIAGIAHPHAADQLVPAIHADGQPVAEIRLAVLLRPARIDILLPALGRRPFDLLHHGLFVGRVVLDQWANNAGIR